MNEHIGYFRGHQYDHFNPPDMWLDDYRYPVMICAAKCGRWFRKVSEDVYDGLCVECYRAQFEGEEDYPL